MKYLLQRLVDPEQEPLTLEEAKRHLNVVDDDIGSPTVPGPNDEDITTLIQVAREYVEDYTGRALVDQTWRLTVGDTVSYDLVDGSYMRYCSHGYVRSHWRSNGIYLRRSPVIELLSVSSIDCYGTLTEFQADGSPEVSPFTLLDAGTKWPRIMAGSSTSWTDRLQIEFRAGFADLTGSPQDPMTKVPATIRHAMKLLIAHYFENREPINIGNIVSKIPLGVDALLNAHKCNLGFA
jgi:uncharacterized phiE125 gp8 family phage protein